jgi:YidC/Oxa1 family membrane protein insertase
VVRVLLFPIVARNLRDNARLRPFQNKIAELVQVRKEAALSRDPVKLQVAGMKQKKIYQDAGVRPGIMMLNGIVQFPVAMGIFFGLKKMCELPVEQLKHSGLSILPDMTATVSSDPWLYGVAIICTALLNVQIRVCPITHFPVF